MRLQYRKTAKGWEGRGQLPQGALEAHYAGKKLTTDPAGHFHFNSPRLSTTELLIRLGDHDVATPVILRGAIPVFTAHPPLHQDSNGNGIFDEGVGHAAW